MNAIQSLQMGEDQGLAPLTRQLNTPRFEHACIDSGLKRLEVPRSRLLQHGDRIYAS